MLEPGDVTFFTAGPDGAHEPTSHEPARHVITAGQASPEVVEYADRAKVLALSECGPPMVDAPAR